MRGIKGAAHWVSIPPAIAVQSYCCDTGDDMFIHTAQAAQAPYLISGDEDLPAVPQVESLQIVSHAQALALTGAGASL